MGGPAASDDDLITAINVTPLVDIVLVLLIIMMVTANYLVNKSINVDLPKAATGEATQTSLSISVDQDGKFYLDGKEIAEDAMKRRFGAAYAANHEVRAIISADGRVQHKRVVRVIDLLRSEKVTKFAINTSPEQLGEGSETK